MKLLFRRRTDVVLAAGPRARGWRSSGGPAPLARLPRGMRPSISTLSEPPCSSGPRISARWRLPLVVSCVSKPSLLAIDDVAQP